MHATEGPLGFPMTDDQARRTDELLRAAVGPFQHLALIGKTLEANSRTDISWISTETADRYNHVVKADGMDDSAFTLNPIVTLNHNYEIPPIGRSLWRKVARIAGTKGIQAMTHYPPRPANIPGDWPPDLCFAQIQAGLLNAKSIGLIPLKLTEPANPDYPLVIEQWALIEYAVGTIPANPDTVVLQINKTIAPAVAPCNTPPTNLAVSIAQRFAAIDIERIIKLALDNLRGTI